MKPRELSASETLQSIIQLAAWTRKEGKSRSGGLNEKGRKSYERENPGSDLKAPSKEAGNPRRASFCARMSGMKKKLTSSKTANDPDSRINKSLKAWNCSAREELNTILFAKKGGDYKRHWSQKKKGKPLSKKQQAEEDEQHEMSARERLEQIISFGIFSIGTAKKVFRGLQGSAERSPLVRPGVFGMGPSFVPKNSPKEGLGMLSSMYGHPGVRPGATVVPRLSAEAQADAAASLPKGAQGIFKDPVAIAAHERGHAYDPKIEARQATQYKRAEQMQKKMGDKAPFEDPKTKPIAQKLMAGMLEHESVANRRVMDQVRQHGTPQEADAWKKYANNQMKVGYRAPMFEGGTAGKSLTEKKDFLRENSFLRRSATALEAKSGALFFNTSNSAGRSGRLSAREELEVIQFGEARRVIRALNGTTLTEKLAAINPKGYYREADMFERALGLGDASRQKALSKIFSEEIPAVRKGIAGRMKAQREQGFSARDQLNTILMGVDVRPRDPMGRFDQAEDGAPNPQHMKVTYGQAAATGAAGVGAGVGLKALYDKLKSMKKK